VGQADPRARPQGGVSLCWVSRRFLPRLGGGISEPQWNCQQVSDHDLKSERASALRAPSVGDYADTSPGTGEDYKSKRPYTLNFAIAFSSNFRPRPGALGSTSMPFSIVGVSS
jgi:hypothetical protein